MTRELGKHSSVEVTKQAAADVWNQLLNRVLVEGGTEEDMKNLLLLHVPCQFVFP